MDAVDQFRLLVALALVDGRLEAAEESVLGRAARRLGVDADEARGIVDQMRQGGRLTQLRPPDDPEERDALLQLLLAVARADGQAAPQEVAVLQRLAPAFGVAPIDVPGLIAGAGVPTLPDVGAAGGGPPPLPAGGGPPPLPAAGGPPPLPGGAGVSLRPPARPTPSRPAPPRAKTGELSCPSCGAPVAFTNQRSVAVVCAYCDTTVARTDRQDALENLGKISHVVEDASPLQLGATGKCLGVEFRIVGRLQVEHPTGYWNEWFLEWADRRTGWLGEAQGLYYVTAPGDEGDRAKVPAFAQLRVGQFVHLGRKRYEVTERRVARATGTQGETPFAVGEGYELPFADLRRPDSGFATIDYSEDPPLVFTGKCVSWRDLNMRNYRRFDGW